MTLRPLDRFTLEEELAVAQRRFEDAVRRVLGNPGDSAYFVAMGARLAERDEIAAVLVRRRTGRPPRTD